jgi:hypothetical protein
MVLVIALFKSTPRLQILDEVGVLLVFIWFGCGAPPQRPPSTLFFLFLFRPLRAAVGF